MSRKPKSQCSPQKKNNQDIAASHAESAKNAVPTDYPLVQLTNQLKRLEESYAHAQVQQSADQKKQLLVQRLLCLFTFCAFGAAFWYAWIGNAQRDIMESQWKDLKRQFEVDQRSLLKITPSFPDAITDSMKIQMIPVNVLNVGKSIALEIAVQGIAEVVKNDKPPSLLVDRHHTLVGISLLYPNDPDRLQIGFGAAGVGQLTQVEISDLQDGRSYLAVYGQAEYRDQFGLHWERYCGWKTYNHAFVALNTRSCFSFNAIGDGKPPTQ